MKKNRPKTPVSSKSAAVLDGVVGALFTATDTEGPFTGEGIGEPPTYGVDFTSNRQNDLVMYHLLEDGTLRGPVGRFETASQANLPTSAQNSIVTYGDMVFVANGVFDPLDVNDAVAGGYVSVFKFTEFGFLRTDVQHSGNGNVQAASLNISPNGKYVYVVHNAFQTGNVGPNMLDPTAKVYITAFEVNDDGTLTPVPDLNQELPDGWVGFDINWTEDGEYLVVVEGSPVRSTVRAYRADKNGKLDGTFLENANNDILGLNSIVAKKLKGENYLYIGAGVDGGVAAYVIDEDAGEIRFINSVITSGFMSALCWLIEYNGFIYSTNARPNTISSYAIKEDDEEGEFGRIELVQLVAADVSEDGLLPFDMYARDGYMHIVMAGSGGISSYKPEDDGTLTSVSYVGGLSSSPAAGVGAFVNQGLAFIEF